jgi:hypothetical protein
MGTKVKRYYAVTSDRSITIHIKRTNDTAEGLTVCGRFITTLWYWSTGKARGRKRHCKQCYR